MNKKENNIDELKKCILSLRKKEISTDRININLDKSKTTPAIDLQEIMNKIDNVINKLDKILGEESIKINKYVDHLKSNKIDFSQDKYDHLFTPYNAFLDYSRISVNPPQNTGKLLDYSFREKLAGFMNKEDKLEWDDERINEFVHSISSIKH